MRDPISHTFQKDWVDRFLIEMKDPGETAHAGNLSINV
jgi:hypothetical protein